MAKLNLGSGGSPLEGYVNVDVCASLPGVNVMCDLNKRPWPFDDASADEIVMSQCLEHLEDHNAAMREIHRILKPGGTALIAVPHFTWQLAYADPTHRHFFAYHTFFYYAGKGHYFDFRFSSCKVRIQFGKRLSWWNYLIEPFANLFPTVYEQSPLRVFPALIIEARLIK